MKRLIALARSAKGATALTLATAVLAAGFTAKIEYDPDEDELRLCLRKVKPIMAALSLAKAST